MFNRATGLTSITISDSVISIGMDAFYDATALASVYFAGEAGVVVKPGSGKSASYETKLESK